MLRDSRFAEPLTLLDLMRQRAESYQDKVAFDYCRFHPGGEEHSQLTYRDLDLKARAVAGVLQRQGAAGERVLVLCHTSLDFIVAFFGCVYAGAVAVPVHPPVRTRVIGRVASIVADVRARFVLTTARLQAEVKPVVDGLAEGSSLQWYAVDSILSDAASEWVAPQIGATALAFLQYTSGSTKAPKGVMISHRNVLANLDLIGAAWGRADDNAVGVFWVPLHHDMGLIGSILEMINVGATCFLMPPEAFIERPMRWLEALSRYRGTITAAPNFAYDLCVERSSREERAALDLSNWSTAMCGGEPIRAATIERFTEAFGPAGFQREVFKPQYGLAESTVLASGRPEWAVPVVRYVDRVALREHRVAEVPMKDPAATQLVGCGHAQPGHEIMIVDPTTRRPCATGEVGEIWLSGGSVAEGYWGKPVETAETFSAFLADSERGPYLRTGDLGFQIEGQLFCTGRLKDLVIIRGRNYCAEDIEATVQASHSALLRGRGAAFSVTSPSNDAERLVVVQEIDRQRIHEGGAHAVIDAISTAVTEHHEVQASSVILVEPLRIPTTSSGKIRRSECRMRFLDGALEVFAEWHAPALHDPAPAAAPAAAPLCAGQTPRPASRNAAEIATWFVSNLSRELELSGAEVDTSLPFAHYGLDSVRAIRLISALETWLGCELSPTLTQEYPTIDELAQHLVETAFADAAELDGAARESGGAASTSSADVAGSPWIGMLTQVPEVSDDDVDSLLRQVIAGKANPNDGRAG